MQENIVKTKLRKGESVVGAFCNIESPAIVEILGILRYDFVIIDAEHGPMDVASCEEMIRAADASNITPIVRIAVNLQQNILRHLDAGALGIQVPMVNTREEAQEVVYSTKYPPLGKRGLASTRSASYGIGLPLSDYVKISNDETLVIVQIETKEALANIKQIASVDMIDLVFLGPTDLSAALGHPGEPTHPEVLETIERAGKIIRDLGKSVGTIARDQKAYAHWRNQGFQYLATGVPQLIAESARAYIQAATEYEKSH